MANCSTIFRLGGRKVIKTLLYCDIIKVLELKNCMLGGSKLIVDIEDFIASTPTCSCIEYVLCYF